jgi:hypothetical protein
MSDIVSSPLASQKQDPSLLSVPSYSTPPAPLTECDGNRRSAGVGSGESSSICWQAPAVPTVAAATNKETARLGLKKRDLLPSSR